jgi:ATP-binding cassette, subfamily G (WHITE), member 2, PDR
VGLGFGCPARQTTPDFLTSMTAPSERVVRPGFENRVPRTAQDFYEAWKNSQAFEIFKQKFKVTIRITP